MQGAHGSKHIADLLRMALSQQKDVAHMSSMGIRYLIG